MPTKVVPSTPVVKKEHDDCGSQSGYAPAVSLKERVEWIVENRCGGNQRELGRRAGLSGNHVGTILTRLRKNPDADIERETLTALARGANVSLQWLSTGDGEPDVEEPTPSSVEVLEGTAWSRIPGWGESVAEIEQRFPTIPSKLLRQIGQTRGSWVQVPMTWEWLIVQANHALKAMPDKERLRLMDEQREALLERELAKDHATPEPPKLEVVPSLPGIEPPAPPAKKSAKR